MDYSKKRKKLVSREDQFDDNHEIQLSHQNRHFSKKEEPLASQTHYDDIMQQLGIKVDSQGNLRRPSSDICMEGGSNTPAQDGALSMNKSINKSVTMNQSVRNRKEAKKLSKYDSNSIDEEEFQDYFSNPQKRKEFDRQRLQQQMREVQNIAGFSLGQFGGKSMKSIRETFPAYPGAEIDSSQNLQQKNYATVSLCCLSVTNPFRNKIIQLVAINPWFDRFILIVIIINCFFLAVDREVQSLDKYTGMIDLIFLLIYTCEMILKIIAMGFFMRAHSYLRDTWNILDFTVVMLGWVSMQFADQNISAIRVIRILRPLRTINSMPGMSSLVQTILNSLPIMFNILVLFCFMLIMFGTIATQLLGGQLENRCYAQNLADPSELSFMIGPERLEMFCMQDKDTCKERIIQHFTELGIQDDPRRKNTIDSAFCKLHENPFKGTFGFDNILLSILNIFQIITLEGWTGMMYIVREAEGSYTFDLLFIFIVLFGAYFVLNLMIAVQFTYLGEAFDEEDRRQKEIKEKIKLKQKFKQEQEEIDDFLDEDDSHEGSQAGGDSQDSQDGKGNEKGKPKKAKRGLCSFPEGSKIYEWSKKVDEMCESTLFTQAVMCLIMLNTLFLASEHYGEAEWITELSEIFNVIFTILFAMEMLIKQFGFGFKKYVSDYFNVFDAIIVCISVLELCLSADKSGLSVLRAFRLTRVFKIIKSWKSLRMLLQTVLKSLSAIGNLGVLTILFLFIAALLAKQFFSGALLDEDGEPSRYSFKKTHDSLITIFIVLTGENWNEIMVQVIDQQKSIPPAAIFFMSLMILGNYMLLNLFLAILLKFISENNETEHDKKHGEGDCEEPEDDVKNATKDGPQKDLDVSAAKKVDGQGQDGLNGSGINSSNSNIEEEFEQIKMQLQQLSNMNMNMAQDKQTGGNTRGQEQYEGGERSKRRQRQRDDGEADSAAGGNRKYGRRNKRNNSNDSDQSLDDAVDPDDIRVDMARPGKQNGSDEEFKDNIVKDDNENASMRKTGKEFKSGKQMPINHVNLKSFAVRNVNQSKKKQKKNIEINESGRSLYIFAHDNCIRLFLKAVIENPYFEHFIYHMIALNSLFLAIESPSLEDKYQRYTLKTLLTVISIIFVAECLIKVIVLGFCIGEKTYLKDSWNVLDFVIVFFSLLTWVLEIIDGFDISFVRGFRALRALRPLRVVSKNEGIKTVVNSLLLSIPSLLNVMLIIIMFLLVFGILGVQLWKGAIAACTNPDSAITNREECIASLMYEQPIYDEVGNIYYYQQMKSEWETPFNNYNNVLYSMITFFEVSTLEMWPGVMQNAIDSVGLDKTMKRGNDPLIAIVFVIYIFLTTFFVMNLFISVIVDKFNDEIKKRQGAHNFTEEQKEWVKIQRLLVHTNPKIIPVEPINCFRLQCFKIVQSQAFEYIIMIAIVINTLFLCIDSYHKSKELKQFLEYANLIFVVVFTFEMTIKITAYGFKYYWHVNWNKFDFIIVIMSLLFINEDLIKSLNFNVTALRIIRVSRLLRMVKTSEGLRSLLKTLYMSLENILTTASLLTLILFTFTVAGMSLFGEIAFSNEGAINKNTNFRSFYLSMSTLWRACTGESWNDIFHACYAEQGFIAVFYWLTFQLFTFFIFMNVFIAVIYENFSDIQASEDENDILSLKKKDIKAFQNTWAKYNPMGELYMRTLRLPDFLRELPPPLGYQGIRIEESKLNKIIFCLNIKDHLGRVYYPEVMWTIFHSIVGINDEKVNHCEQITNILKIVKRKYKGLGKKVNLDSLCGNKYYRNELTAIKYIQAMKILTKWRNFKNLRIKQKEQKMINKMQNGAGGMQGKPDGVDTKKLKDKTPPREDEKHKGPVVEAPDDASPEAIREKRVENIKKQVQLNQQREQDEPGARNGGNKRNGSRGQDDDRDQRRNGKRRQNDYPSSEDSGGRDEQSYNGGKRAAKGKKNKTRHVSELDSFNQGADDDGKDNQDSYNQAGRNKKRSGQQAAKRNGGGRADRGRGNRKQDDDESDQNSDDMDDYEDMPETQRNPMSARREQGLPSSNARNGQSAGKNKYYDDEDNEDYGNRNNQSRNGGRRRGNQ